MLRREVIKMAGGLFGLGKPTPSRFPYPGRPQPSPGVAPSSGQVIKARQVIVFGTNGGVFVYSGTPALGNLIASITGAAGTDQFGNVFLQGTAEYAYIGSTPNSASRQLGGVVQFFNWTGSNWGSPVGIVGTGGTTTLQLQGATKTQVTGTVFDAGNGATVEGGLTVTGGTKTDTLNATGNFTSTGGTTSTPAVASTAGMTGTLPVAQTDITEITAALATGVTITKTWTIPANDSQPGTVYRLTCGGWGTQAGTTAVGLTINVLAFTHVFAGNAMSAATIPAGATFHWKYEVDLIMVTNGATGTARASGRFTWNQAATPGANETVALGQTSSSDSSPCDTTSASSMRATATWASVTNAPTLTCMYSTFERLGP